MRNCDCETMMSERIVLRFQRLRSRGFLPAFRSRRDQDAVSATTATLTPETQGLFRSVQTARHSHSMICAMTSPNSSSAAAQTIAEMKLAT